MTYLTPSTCLECLKKPCLWLAACLCFLLPAIASAAPGCQTSTGTGTASFSSQTCIKVNSSTQNTSIANAGVACGGSLLTVLGASGYINAVVSTTNGSKLKNAAGDTIPYQIFADQNYTYQITPGTALNYYNATILNLLGLTGSNNVPLPMYFRTVTGALNLSSGTYTDTVTVNWSWSICTVVSLGSLCIGPVNTGSTSSIVNISLQIGNDCTINAPNISFGTAPLVSAFSPVTQTISVQCTKGTSYTVGLSDGSNASSGQRRMANGGNYINYEIYQGASGTTRWGSTAGQTRASGSADVNPGAGTGNSTQGFVYNSKVLSGQTTPPAGTYTDTVVISVGF